MTMFSDISRYPPATAVRYGFGRFTKRLGHLVDHLVAAALARRQRQATLTLLRHLSDRELKDIGLQRGEIEYGLEEAAKQRRRVQGLDVSPLALALKEISRSPKR
jgi:uncharacterized protein YjiS (DUF1127 family)